MEKGQARSSLKFRLWSAILFSLNKCEMADEVGFEPTEPFRVRPISSRMP